MVMESVKHFIEIFSCMFFPPHIGKTDMHGKTEFFQDFHELFLIPDKSSLRYHPDKFMKITGKTHIHGAVCSRKQVLDVRGAGYGERMHGDAPRLPVRILFPDIRPLL